MTAVPLGMLVVFGCGWRAARRRAFGGWSPCSGRCSPGSAFSRGRTTVAMHLLDSTHVRSPDCVGRARLLVAAVAVQVTRTGAPYPRAARGGFVLLLIERTLGDWVADTLGPIPTVLVFIAVAGLGVAYATAEGGRARLRRAFAAADAQGYHMGVLRSKTRLILGGLELCGLPVWLGVSTADGCGIVTSCRIAAGLTSTYGVNTSAVADEPGIVGRSRECVERKRNLQSCSCRTAPQRQCSSGEAGRQRPYRAPDCLACPRSSRETVVFHADPRPTAAAHCQLSSSASMAIRWP